MACLHRRRGRDKTVFSCPCRRCKQAIKVAVYKHTYIGFNSDTYYKMWQLTMYCHWRLPDAMSLLTQNVFGASDARYLISMVTFTFTMQRHLIRLASATYISSRLATFGWVGSREKDNAEFTKSGWELWSYLKPFVDQSTNFLRRCRKPLVLSNVLHRLSVSRFVQKIFAIKSQSRRKTEQMQKFVGPQFCRKDCSDFSTAIC